MKALLYMLTTGFESMQNSKTLMRPFLVPLIFVCILSSVVFSKSLSVEDVTASVRQAARWQIETSWGSNPTVDNDWINASFMASLMEVYKVLPETGYLNFARQWAANAHWSPTDIYGTHADGICCVSTYADLYLLNPHDSLQYMLAKGYTNLDFLKNQNFDTPLWWYPDAIYMGPPSVAKLAYIRNDSTDWAFLHREFIRNRDSRRDSLTGLYYAPYTYEFWSRGDGWVIAGLSRMIPFLKTDDPYRPEYIRIFQTLAAALAIRQQTDGLWRSDLNNPEAFPGPETSGSAFFVYGMAWGVNNGFLPAATYVPVINRGWEGLLRCLDTTGRLGYVQDVAVAPDNAYWGTSKPYAQGGFIMAGAEIIKSMWIRDSTAPSEPSNLSAEVTGLSLRLSWSPGMDAQSGVMGYRVYCGASAGALSLLMEIEAETLITLSIPEYDTLYYAVGAINTRGLESGLSSVIMAIGGKDTVKPIVTAVSALMNSVSITFSEKVEQSSAEKVGNYTISSGVLVTDAIRQADQKTVVLSVPALNRGTMYSLRVAGIRDQASIANTMDTLDTTFYHSGSATISLTADNIYDLYFNGRLVGSDSDWRIAEKYSVDLQPGKNVIAVKAVDLGAPGGLLADITCDFLQSGTNNGWKTGAQEQTDWTATGFDDASWSPATVLAAYGGDPWDNVPGMPTGTTAQWIWNAGGSDIVYFRYVIDVSNMDIDTGIITSENLYLDVSPNPFNPSTSISYYLPQKGDISLLLYNLQGKMIRQIVSGVESAGRHTMNVEAVGLASGIYICELKAGAMAKRIKLVLMR